MFYQFQAISKKMYEENFAEQDQSPEISKQNSEINA